MKMKPFIFFLSLFVITFSSAKAQESTRLLRFPAIYDQQIVFSYAGDLYTVTEDGGIARRLTSHIGYEMFPRFSPDGKTIAFTGQYDGNTEVFTMPSNGGNPKRLTITATLHRDDIGDRMGPNNIVMTWTPDGKSVIYRSRKQSFNSFVGQLFSVPVNGGLSSELPLPTGGFCSYNKDGSKLAYNRVFREFRTWKYYKGGMADDIWIYDFKSKKTENITNNIAQDIFPMWYGNEIYFCSDRDRIMNLFVYNTENKSIRKVTNFTEYDVKFPSISKNKIVFENGGYIYVFDIKEQSTKKINIQVLNDESWARNEYKDASKNISSADISPNGERAVFSARGDIYSVPAEKGLTYNFTQSSGYHDRNATWSPDGKYIAYISDMSGEFEIYIQDQAGKEKPQQLTSNADTYIFDILWSPDSKKILFNDRKMRLRYIDIESKKITEVTQSKLWEINDFDWSPDSKWIAYSKNAENQFGLVYLYNLDTKKSTPVTDNWYDSGNPSFSRDGKYLFFSSARDFNPTYSQTEWNHSYSDMSRIYFVTLSKDTPSPFAPENNLVKFDQDDSGKDKKDEKKEGKKDEDKTVKVDLDGIGNRILSLNTTPGYYWNINCINGKVYYNTWSQKKGKQAFKFYDLKKQKEELLDNGVSYSLSSSGKKIMVSKQGKFYIVDLPSAKLSLKTPIPTSDMKVWVDRKAEWNQIYYEAWRQMRDFFYDPGMHGTDWNKLKEKYAVLLPYVNNRKDLNYVIGELIGELSIGHAYISGGDSPSPDRIQTGLLGAKISKHSSGYFKIDEILEGANWSKKLRSPLTEIGVNVKEGDYIIAVNGKSARSMNDVYSALIDKAGKEVEITFNSKPGEEGSHTALIVPIADESALYYFNWVSDNVRKVSEATDGKVGYIHVPDMGVDGLNEFVKYFYPQLDKKALIIDDRGNGGGNVSPMLIERLRREVTRANMARNVQIPGQTPRQMMLGPKVLLVNNYSASDGDLFPYSFKKHKLGKVIGVRTWGGVVGIRGSLPFIDGTDLRKPEFASYSSEESKWIIEGHGVEPDIVVDNDPAKEYQGIDQQLNKAIEVILEELKDYDKKIPPIPEFPDKTK